MNFKAKPIILGQNQHILNNDYIKDFIFAGKAIITIKNIENQNHFTFQINQCKDIIKNDKDENIRKQLWFVSVCRSYNEWLYIGLLNKKHNFIPSKKLDSDTISIKTFQFILNHYVYNNNYDKRVEFYHEGYCMKCGRLLTEPDSVKLGLGPFCRSLINL